ncbi:MAG: PAS domain-containing sensor histidine kinase [Pseudomonadota bacterium]
MNIPKSDTTALFGIDSTTLSGESLLVHFAADALVAGAYILLLFGIVYLNHKKYISIIVPKRSYLVAFMVILALTFGASVASLVMPQTNFYLVYKVFMALLLGSIVLGIWRVIPRDIDPLEQNRLQRENVFLNNAIARQHEVEARLADAVQDVDSKVTARTAELSAENLRLEKNIIESRLAEERASEAKRRMDELIMRTNTAMVFVDSDGTVQECNHALAQLLGRGTIEELVGRKLGRLLGLRDETPLSHLLDETLRHGMFAAEMEVIPPARGRVHVEANAVGTVMDGRPCVMALFRDVTERKAEERELLQSREALSAALEVARQANATRADFLAKMNHELRTPLNGIIGLSEILRHKAASKTIPGAEVRKLTGNIHQSGTHLLSVVDDLLDISRLDVGNREFSPAQVAVRAEIDSAVLTLVTIADKKRIAINNTCDPDFEWFVDQRAFKQIIINLVNNAVKFSPVGSTVHIDITHTPDAMSLHIRDEGPGIAREDQERIMMPFGRGEAATTNKIDGVGLGLTIVSELLKLQGGKIVINSEVGHGATFTAVFPSAEQVAHSEVAMPNRKSLPKLF